MTSVLFLVQFNKFDWTSGFYWELHALTLAVRSFDTANAHSV